MPEGSRTGPRDGGRRRVRAYVGLGANVGDARATLEAAVAALAALPGVRVRAVSPLYLTRPVGVTDQPDFHNAVVSLDVPAGIDPASGAMALLAALKGIERDLGRRVRRRWGPREADLDLLVFGRARLRVERTPDARSDDPSKPSVQWLEVPHVSAAARLFVLAPLADLAPGLVAPGWGATAATLRDRALAAEGPDAIATAGRWDAARRRWVGRT